MKRGKREEGRNREITRENILKKNVEEWNE